MNIGFLNNTLQILPLDLDRDFAEIDRLLDEEEWPFTRSDLEVSHAQPNATALVARADETIQGFFAAHHFGDVGYLDMMIVDKRARVSHVARRLYFDTVRQMKRKGIRAWVAHSTNDSFRMFKFLRFSAGQTFTLLARDPQDTRTDRNVLESLRLGTSDFESITDLDEDVFGLRRSSWLEALLRQSTTQFFGQRQDGNLIASICLRARKHDAMCLDAVNSRSFDATSKLLDQVVAGFANRRVECFARTDSPLHHYLLDHGFFVPDFFKPIGPLVEWRKGEVGDIGTSPLVQCLSWF